MAIGRVTGPGGRTLQHTYDGKTLSVRPPAPVPPHGMLTFDVAYETVRPKKGAYFIDRKHVMWTQGETEDTHYWVPTYDYPNDRETWEFYITTARNERALSNGRLAGQRDVPGGIEWHWVLDRPASTYLMSAVTGDFAVIRDHWQNVPVDYWVYPDSVEAGKRGFGMTPHAIDVFSRETGVPYPWAKYDQSAVPDYIFGGMENVTATTQNDDGILHPAWSEPETYSGGLVSHELGHQWYGDLLTTKTWAHIWLNEGFATFMQQTFTLADQGKDESDLDRRGARQQVIDADLRARRPIVYDRYVTDPLELFFSGHIYPKGATILQMLRHQLGDSLFWAAMHRYTVDHEYQNVVSADLERAFEQTTGRDYARFFHDWVYGAGFPVFQVSYGYDAATRRLTLDAKEVQPRDSLTGFFDDDVEVSVLTDAGPVAGRVPLRDGHGSLALQLSGPPRAIAWDPEGWLLQEADFPRPTVMLAYQLAKATTVDARLDAVAELARRVGQADAAAAAAALGVAAHGDAFWGVRHAAVEALAGFGRDSTAASAAPPPGGESARAALLAATNDADPRVRDMAAGALVRFPSADVVARMRALTDGDPSLFVRGSAVHTLAALDPQAALPVIEGMLRQSSWTDVLRANALTSLARVSADQSLPILEQYIGPSNTRFARQAAIETLTGAARGQEQDVARKLEPLLGDPDLFIRAEAAQALGALGQSSSVGALEARRRVEAEGRVLQVIDQALAQLRGR